MVDLSKPPANGVTIPADLTGNFERCPGGPAAPRITVVIPVRNSRDTLAACLKALQRSPLYEAISIRIVYDGEEPYGVVLDPPGKITELRSRAEANAGVARNTGAMDINEGIIVFIDADVALEPEALPKLINPILIGEADACVGNYSRQVQGLNFFQKFKQLYIATIYSRRKGPIKNEFWSAFGAVTAEAFMKVRGFSESYSGAAGEDTELGLRLTNHDFTILAVPEAAAIHLHKFTFRSVIRNDFRKGIQSFLNGLRHRSLQDHRHSSKRDIMAVSLVGLSCISLMSAWVAGGAGLLATIVLITAWLMARADVIATWFQEGLVFLARALPTAFLLDFVRGVSVGVALILFSREKAQGRSSPMRVIKSS